MRWVGAAPNCGKFEFENSQKKGRVYCVVLYKQNVTVEKRFFKYSELEMIIAGQHDVIESVYPSHTAFQSPHSSLLFIYLMFQSPHSSLLFIYLMYEYEIAMINGNYRNTVTL